MSLELLGRAGVFVLAPTELQAVFLPLLGVAVGAGAGGGLGNFQRRIAPSELTLTMC